MSYFPTNAHPTAYRHPTTYESVSGIHFHLGGTTTESYGQLFNMWNRPQPVYLPLLSVSIKAHVISTTTRTTLTQTFHNPSEHLSIPEAKYTFPLYANCCVLSFVCHIGDTKVITGVVQPKEKAKAAYDNAVQQDRTAGLLEQKTAEVFTTQLGNIPPGATIKVEIGYITELKHDSEADGVKFTVPMAIAPRYGVSPPGAFGDKFVNKPGEGIGLSVEVTMAEKIRSVQSSSHPISVHLGTHYNSASEKKPEKYDSKKALVTLFQSDKVLAQDFVLMITTITPHFLSLPQALLETHPTIQNQQALMLTLVPRFNAPESSKKPDLIFLVDRSGSMQDKLVPLKSALRVFLKSLPVNCRFNIVSFGSTYSFLWPQPQDYTRESLGWAEQHIEEFGADLGGTEILPAMEELVKRREVPGQVGNNTEVMILTDGEMWELDRLLRFVKMARQQSKGRLRVFSLGIGRSVSHALVEGVAVVGGGFSQVLAPGEEHSGGGTLEGKVIRMLNSALSDHTGEYKLEIIYEEEGDMSADSSGDSEYTLNSSHGGNERRNSNIKRVASQQPSGFSPTEKARKLSLFIKEASPLRVSPKPEGKLKSGSFSNKSAKNGSRFSHLKDITGPEPLQAPFNIPNLFPFERSTVYLLLPPSKTLSVPKSVTLKATTAAGDELALSIPVTRVEVPGITIHQLGAQMVLRDLEEGRSWIHSGNYGVSTYEKPEKIAEYVEREGERLGVKWALASKWTSFVAIEEEILYEEGEVSQEGAKVADEQKGNSSESFDKSIAGSDTAGDTDEDTPPTAPTSTSMMDFVALPQLSGEQPTQKTPTANPSAHSLLRRATKTTRVVSYRGGSSMFRMLETRPCGPVMTPQIWDSINNMRNGDEDYDPYIPNKSTRVSQWYQRSPNQFKANTDNGSGFMFSELQPPQLSTRVMPFCPNDHITVGDPTISPQPLLPPDGCLNNYPPVEQAHDWVKWVLRPYTPTPLEKVDKLIRIQIFDGSYSYTTELLEIMEFSDSAAATKFMELSSAHTTALVAVYMSHRLGQFRDMWLLIVNKAWAFVDAAGDRTELEKRATELVTATAGETESGEAIVVE